MNPHVFHGNKLGEDPKECFDKVYNIIDALGVTLIENAELATYQFKMVFKILYTQWKKNTLVGAGLIHWQGFKLIFLDRFFLQEYKEVKVEEILTSSRRYNCSKILG